MSKDKNHNSPLDKPELKKSVFQVPDAYFDKLESRIMESLDAEKNDVLDNEKLRQSPFQVPEAYFEQLEERVMAEAHTEDSELVNNDHLKKHVFVTPDSYFDSLEQQVVEQAEAENKAVKTIPLYRQNWFKMAVAAMLVAGFFLIRPFVGPEVDGFDAFSNVSNETLLEYLYDQSDADLELIASVDGFDMAIDEILAEEAVSFDFDLGLNPELEYDFEYYEQ